MLPRELQPKPSSPLSRELRNYRATHHLTQEQLASDLHVDVRTLRRWENDQVALENVRELRRIADFLGIEPEHLGVTTSLFVPRTLAQIDEVVDHVWSLVGKARNYEARLIIENLIRELTAQLVREDHALLRRLAHAHHVAGYVVSLNTKTSEISMSIAHFQEMERIARIINDHTLLNLALTYHGDMLRRCGDLTQAIAHLEAARDSTPRADIAARGNGIQLLARAYLQNKNVPQFETAMIEAEKQIYEIDANTSSARGLYCLGTVYEEYARSYGYLGDMQKGLDYLERAAIALSPSTRWHILLKTTKAVILLRGGELRTGEKLAIEAAQLCRVHGNIRCLERICGVCNYLESKKQEVEQVTASIREAIDGPLGRWDVTNQA
jgi:transcriptional regulator with XRE-family HTH domain